MAKTFFEILIVAFVSYIEKALIYFFIYKIVGVLVLIIIILSLVKIVINKISKKTLNENIKSGTLF